MRVVGLSVPSDIWAPVSDFEDLYINYVLHGTLSHSEFILHRNVVTAAGTELGSPNYGTSMWTLQLVMQAKSLNTHEEIINADTNNLPRTEQIGVQRGDLKE